MQTRKYKQTGIKVEIPYIDPNQEIDADILAFSGILKMPSRMEIDSDPRLESILTQ